MGGAVNALLSWRVWTPLARLTYNAYLLHFIVILYFYYTKVCWFPPYPFLLFFQIFAKTFLVSLVIGSLNTPDVDLVESRYKIIHIPVVRSLVYLP